MVSPNGTWVVSTPWNSLGGIKVWDARTGECVNDLWPDIRVANVSFSPEGDWLVTRTAADYQFWKVGDWHSGRTIHRETDNDNPGPIAWSPDGSVLAVAISSRRIQLQETASGRPLATLEAPNTDQVSWMDFSADGNHLIVVTPSPGCLRTWDLRAIREQLATLRLDWDLPPYPPAQLALPMPARAQVQLGELTPKTSASSDSRSREGRPPGPRNRPE